MEPLTTLHLTNAWHATSGGIATFYRELFAAAGRRGWNMRLVAPGEADSVERVGERGLLYRVRAPAAPFNPAYRILYPHLYLRQAAPLRRILAAERPDVVELSDKYTLLYLTGLLRIGSLPGCGRPVTVGLSHERFDVTVATYLWNGPGAADFARAYMKCLYFPQCDHHIAVSGWVAEELLVAARGHKVRRGVWVQPMGVDSSLFHPSRRSPERRAALGLPPDARLLLYTGRLAPEKNLGLLTEMMRRLPPLYQLLVCGSGTAQAQFVRDAAAAAPGHVHMLGHEGDRSRLAAMTATADVFVHPNPREPFGIAPLEAMASGIPLVAPDRGGVLAYASSETAWLVPPEPAAFAGAVESVFSDPSRAARVHRARLAAEALDWSRVTARFLDLYAEMHALSRGRSREPRIRPLAFSTPGNWLGFETAAP